MRDQSGAECSKGDRITEEDITGGRGKRNPWKPGTTIALIRDQKDRNFRQILAMIDKRYAYHREGFKNPISTEMMEPVTATVSLCACITASKAPTAQSSSR
jgi:hypothetical protein